MRQSGVLHVELRIVSQIARLLQVGISVLVSKGNGLNDGADEDEE